jgi:hypothetical protein
LFSTMTGCLRRKASFWPTMREAVSVGPPAGKGTISLMVLLGQACAKALPASIGRARASRTRRVGLESFSEKGLDMDSPE